MGFSLCKGASQKEIKTINNNNKEEEDVTNFPSTSAVKRCVVIVEGDPHPVAARGRMSFLSFNPSIDKLNGEESDPCKKESSAVDSGRQSETTSTRKRLDSCDLKRKQAEVALESPYLNKSKKNNHDSSPSSRHSSHKQHTRVKLDWNVLRPPKYPNKTR